MESAEHCVLCDEGVMHEHWTEVSLTIRSERMLSKHDLNRLIKLASLAGYCVKEAEIKEFT